MTFPEAGPVAAPAGDTLLVTRARSGEAEAIETLVLRHRRGVFLLALQLLGNREDALDATQDSLIRFLGSLDRFDGDRPVRPWLYTIVRNRCRDLLRRRRVRRWEPLESDDETWRPELVDPSADPLRDATAGELEERIWSAIDRLSPEHREIVVLRDYQDLSYSEIAEVLNIPRGTVMSRLHRARKHLASLLAEITDTDSAPRRGEDDR